MKVVKSWTSCKVLCKPNNHECGDSVFVGLSSEREARRVVHLGRGCSEFRVSCGSFRLRLGDLLPNFAANSDWKVQQAAFGGGASILVAQISLLKVWTMDGSTIAWFSEEVLESWAPWLFIRKDLKRVIAALEFGQVLV